MTVMKFLIGLWILAGALPAVSAVAPDSESNRAEKNAHVRSVLWQKGPRRGRPPGGHLRRLPPPRLWQKLKDLPAEEQERILRNNRRFQRLPQERQKKILERFRRFQQLPPEQRERIERRFHTFRNLTPEQRRKARQIYQQHWRKLPAERREALIEEFRRLRKLSPEERDQRLGSEQLKQRFDAEERELLRELSELRILLRTPRRGDSRQGFGPPGRPSPQQP